MDKLIDRIIAANFNVLFAVFIVVSLILMSFCSPSSVEHIEDGDTSSEVSIEEPNGSEVVLPSSFFPNNCMDSPYTLKYWKAANLYSSPERRKYWCLLVRQGWAESSHRPDAISPADAQGIAQFMLPTWDMVVKRSGLAPGSSPLDPDAAIRAQAWYMQYLSEKWIWQRPPDCREHLALCSYEAGLRTCLGWQEDANMAICWYDEIRERGYKSTQWYIDKITGRIQ